MVPRHIQIQAQSRPERRLETVPECNFRRVVSNLVLIIEKRVLRGPNCSNLQQFGPFSIPSITFLAMARHHSKI